MALAITGDSNNSEGVFAPLLAENGIPIYTNAQLADEDSEVNNPLTKKGGSIVLEYVETDFAAAITAISKAANAVITVTNTGIQVGDMVIIDGGDMVEFTTEPVRVVSLTSTTAITVDYSTVGFTTYTTGGTGVIQHWGLCVAQGADKNARWEHVDLLTTETVPV